MARWLGEAAWIGPVIGVGTGKESAVSAAGEPRNGEGMRGESWDDAAPGCSDFAPVKTLLGQLVPGCSADDLVGGCAVKAAVG